MGQFSGKFRLLDDKGQELEAADAAFVVEEGALKADPRNQPSLRVDWADVDLFELGDYLLKLKLASGETVEVSMLGKRTREFTDELLGSLRAFQAKNLLLEEPVGGEGFAGELTRDGESCEAQARVFATSLAIVPRAMTPFNLPFGELSAFTFDEGRYAVDLASSGGALALSKLGKQTQPFLRLLEQRVAELRRRGLEALTALLPQIPSMAMRGLGAAMADGVPARREQLDAISPEIWPALIKAGVGEKLRQTFDDLTALCPAGEVAVAIKETNQRQDSDEPEEVSAEEQAEAEEGEAPELPEQMQGRVVWYAFPILNQDRAKPGNAVAIEAVTRSGRATYLFRIVPAQVYQEASWEELLELARQRVRSVSRAMVALSFKREPIYLSAEKLNTAPYARYRLALRLSAPLKASRANFLGRAIHGKGWKKQLDHALAKARS